MSYEGLDDQQRIQKWKPGLHLVKLYVDLSQLSVIDQFP